MPRARAAVGRPAYVDAGPNNVGPVGTNAPSAVWLAPVAGGGVIESDGNGVAVEWMAGGLLGGYEHQVAIGGDAMFGVGAG